jgi:hypothetical protein
MQNIHYPSTTADSHSCSNDNSSSTIKSCVQLMKSNVYTNARKRYAIVFKHPIYKSKTQNQLCANVYNQKFNQGAKWYSYSRQAKSYEKINIRIISYIYIYIYIYIINLIITPMHFHKINDQASHIKCKSKG